MTKGKRMGGMSMSDCSTTDTKNTIPAENQNSASDSPPSKAATQTPRQREPSTKTAQSTASAAAASEPTAQPATKPITSRKATRQRTISDKPMPINIKILKSQQDWLRDTAQQVRNNNTMPVPARNRVFPQHLISVAIDMLQDADVDWSQIRHIEELRDALKD